MKNEKVYTSYDFDKDNFGKKIKGDVDIDYKDGIFTFDFDDRTYKVDTTANEVLYRTDSCEFIGNAYRFTCTYMYNDKDDWINYDYTTLTSIGIKCSDGTVGEVKLGSEDDMTAQATVEILVKLGLRALTDTVIEAAETGQPLLKVADMTLEMTTGEGFSDRINNVVDDAVDSYNSNGGINGMIENYKQEQEEKEAEERRREQDEKMKEVIKKGYVTFE